MQCPLCQNLSVELATAGSLESLISDDYNPAVHKCRFCQSQFLYPIAPEGWLTNYFSKAEARTDSQKKQLEDPMSESLYKEIAVARACWIKKRIGKDISSVYDIGCGPGWLVAAFQDMGYRTVGIDPNPIFCKFAREKLNVKVIEETLEKVDVNELNGKADLVTLVHLVHMAENIEQILLAALKKLKRRGYIFLEIPNEVYYWRTVKQKILHGRETLPYYRLCKTIYPTKKGITQLMNHIGIRPLYTGTFFPPVINTVIKGMPVFSNYQTLLDYFWSIFGFGKVIVMLGQKR
ncbi:MAG: class I SAM-dependent methyltransferase [Planctomycetaceae bacterium]|nr:MAG: class I SAM-dependent methyltransferase [Planctomycetaceae bacterium]